MAVTVPKETAAYTLTFTPDSRWSSYTATAYKPDGTSLGSLVDSTDTVDTTVASATDANTFVLASASGVTPGRSYIVSDSAVGTAQIVEVESVNSTTITTVTPLAQAPSVGATFKDVEIYVRLSATATPDYDTYYYVDLVNSSTDEQMRVYYHVVRQVFEKPMTEQRLRKLIQSGWGTHPIMEKPQTLRDVVERVNDKVEAELLRMGQFPHLLGDVFALRDAGIECALFVLAHEHRTFPRGTESKDVFVDTQERRFLNAVGAAHVALTGHDLDNDGEVDEPETGRANFARWSL